MGTASSPCYNQRRDHAKSVNGYKKFPGRSHYIIGQDGWEGVADYTLDWATEHAATPPGTLSVAQGLFTELPKRNVLGDLRA